MRESQTSKTTECCALILWFSSRGRIFEDCTDSSHTRKSCVTKNIFFVPRHTKSAKPDSHTFIYIHTYIHTYRYTYTYTSNAYTQIRMINNTERRIPSMTSPMAQLGRAVAVASSSSSSSFPSTSQIFVFNRLKELRKAAQSGFDSARRNISENKDAKKAKAVCCASMSAAQYNSKHNRNKKNENTKEIMVPSSNNKFFGAMIPGDSAVEVVLTSGLFSTLNIYNTLLIGRLICTWFPGTPQQIVYPLATICDPYLNLFRGILPPLGALDLSPILAFTALNFFTSTAAALPAQIDGEGNIVGVAEKKNNAFKGFLFAAKKEEKR